MREILFKAKGQTSGRWYEGLLTRLDKDVCWIKDGHHDKWICDTSTLCQYTGLNDGTTWEQLSKMEQENFLSEWNEKENRRNQKEDWKGKKIWENDILKTNNGRLCKIIWLSSPRYQGFDLKPIESKNPAPSEWNLWEALDVIGNVFDNPEIFEQEGI